MRVLHVIPSLSASQGGPSVALPAMAKALEEQGMEVDVVTTDDDGVGQRLAEVPHGLALQRDGFRVFYFSKQTDFYKVSLPLLVWLIRHVRDYDVVHVHAVFSFASLAAGWMAALQGVPFIVRPLGVLSAWGMGNRRRWMKGLSFRLIDKPMLNRAAAMHYTSEQEAADAERLQLKASPVVIPLGIDVKPFDKRPEVAQQPGQMVLFMSRIDPKKGIELLLAAVAKLAPQMPELRLVIAGSGEAEYIRRLQDGAEALGIGPRVFWPGFLELEGKRFNLAMASVFVLPSYSENFGIALLEAMAAGVPCIASDQVALAVDAARHDAVQVVRCDADDLSAALRQLLGDEKRREQLAKRAAEVARRHYSVESMADSLMKLYQREGIHSEPHHG
jgi:glycosyltransferase involved in cell wall biosynthesis